MLFSFFLLHPYLPTSTLRLPIDFYRTLVFLTPFFYIYTARALGVSPYRAFSFINYFCFNSNSEFTAEEEMTTANQEADMKKILREKQCSKEAVKAEAVKAGAKAAAIACIASAIPIMLGARAIPWARANLNHAAQALIVSTISGSAYFIVADKTILKSARRNSFRDQMRENDQAEYSPF